MFHEAVTDADTRVSQKRSRIESDADTCAKKSRTESVARFVSNRGSKPHFEFGDPTEKYEYFLVYYWILHAHFF